MNACVKCGCTEDSLCDNGGEQCCWIDKQRNLCSRCALAFLAEPIEPSDLAEATLVIRALRAMLFETARTSESRLTSLEQLVMHVAGNQGMIEAGAGPVFGPSGERAFRPADDHLN